MPPGFNTDTNIVNAIFLLGSQNNFSLLNFYFTSQDDW